MAWKNETVSNNLTLIVTDDKIGSFSKCLNCISALILRRREEVHVLHFRADDMC